MDYALSPQEVAVRLGAALLCGLFIGLDREVKRKSVGVRTFLLVCLGSTSFTITVLEISHYYVAIYDDITPDPTRIVQGIVTGIGFLGGGAILQSKGHIAGTSTGASIWVSGGIGVACGYGFYWHAFIFTGYVFAVLVIIGYVRPKFRDDIEDDKGNIANTIRSDETE